MNIPKFLTRLLTTSKHTDPAIAAAETPVLEAAKSVLAPAVAHIADPLAALETDVLAAFGKYAASIGGGAGVALTPVINMGLQFGAQAISGVVAHVLDGSPAI